MRRLLNRRCAPPGWVARRSTAKTPLNDLEPVHLPFGLAGLGLLSWSIDQDTVKPGAPIDLFTYWEVSQPITPPLKIFLHLTAPDGTIVAQWDGLDVNIGSLDFGDMFVQRWPTDRSSVFLLCKVCPRSPSARCYLAGANTGTSSKRSCSAASPSVGNAT